LPLWSSLCLHISRPFSGGVVFYFHFIFLSSHHLVVATYTHPCASLFCTWLPPVRHFSGGMVLLPAVSINTLR
jgi:hypothetical protein